MLPELLQKSSLFALLFKIDSDLAEKTRLSECPICGSALHYANYDRKPRGGPANLPDEYFLCFSLCCGREGCRKRIKPPSVRFWDRRVYWSTTILVVMALRQNRPNSYSTYRLSKMLDIDSDTIRRWISYFQVVFPDSARWQSIRGRIASKITNSNLPGALLAYFIGHSRSEESGLIECLKFLSSGLPPLVIT